MVENIFHFFKPSVFYKIKTYLHIRSSIGGLNILNSIEFSLELTFRLKKIAIGNGLGMDRNPSQTFVIRLLIKNLPVLNKV